MKLAVFFLSIRTPMRSDCPKIRTIRWQPEWQSCSWLPSVYWKVRVRRLSTWGIWMVNKSWVGVKLTHLKDGSNTHTHKQKQKQNVCSTASIVDSVCFLHLSNIFTHLIWLMTMLSCQLYRIGLSRERVRQVGLVALEKLKHGARKKELEAMLVQH